MGFVMGQQCCSSTGTLTSRDVAHLAGSLERQDPAPDLLVMPKGARPSLVRQWCPFWRCVLGDFWTTRTLHGVVFVCSSGASAVARRRALSPRPMSTLSPS